MSKKVKESTLRKELINMVLDFTPDELLDCVFDYGNGEFNTSEIDWDVCGGHQAIGIETLPEGEPRDPADKVFRVGYPPTP